MHTDAKRQSILDEAEAGNIEAAVEAERERLAYATLSGDPQPTDRGQINRFAGIRRVPPGVLLSILTLAVLVVLAALAPLLTSYDPTQAVLGDRLMPPMWLDGGTSAHILGTDGLGRDVLTRLLYGARVSLSVAGLVILFGGGIGAIVGIVAAYFGGLVDTILMRTADIIMALPTILVAIVLAVAIGPSFQNIVVVISILLWPKIARQVRGDALVVKEQDYFKYSRAIGILPRRIMFRHMLPNVTPSLLVIVTLEIGAVILTESTLGFLGAGIPPPEPSWGLIIADGAELLASSWWIAVLPGVCIMASVLVFNTLGDWLRDVLDPRLKQR